MTRPAVQPGAARWPTASTAPSAGLLAALLLLVWKATYNGAFWGTAGARSSGGRLAQW